MKKKLKKISKRSAYLLSIAIVGTLVGISVQFVRAWAPPTGTPPNANVSAPVLTDGNQNVKMNVASIDSLMVKNLIVDERGGRITFGGITKTTWPQTYEPGSKSDFPAGTGSFFVVPYGVNKIHVEAWGAGGGGAAGRHGLNQWGVYDETITSGGSGGSGAYVRADIINLKAGDTILVYTGKGGAGASRIDRTDWNVSSNGGVGESSYVSIQDRLTSARTRLITANGGAGGLGHDDGYDRTGTLLCDTGNSRVRAAGGIAESSLAGADLRNGIAGNYCVMERNYAGWGEWAGTIPLTNRTSNGAVVGLDAPFLKYGEGGYGTVWGTTNRVPGVAKAGDGSDGKIIFSW